MTSGGRREALGWGTVLVVCLLGGTVTLFVAFLFAYGFSDEVRPGQHVAFLVMLLLSAVALGLLAGLLFAAMARLPVRVGLAFGVAASLALHLLTLAGGVVVSLTHEDENSVTADQADWPFVLLVVLAVVGAVASGTIAHRRLGAQPVSA